MKAFLIAIAITLFFSSCYSFKQDMGKGIVKSIGKDSTKAKVKVVSISKKRWFLMWGLSPLNTVDSKKMAKGTNDYTVKQRFTITDVLISIPTAFFLSTETVTIKKQVPILPKSPHKKKTSHHH